MLLFESLTNIIALENLNIAGGDIKSPQRKFTLRTRGDFRNLSDIRKVVVSVKGGAPVYLYDIATVYEGPAERTELMRLNGKSSVIIRLSKQSDKNTVLVCRNVYKRLDEMKNTLPQGFAVEPIFDQSEYIEQAISSLTDSAWQGSVLAIFVVFVFLRNIRSALILGLSIPLSIIATFIAMYVNGISLNMMSMGGLALGVGMLIDNSIVVLDNIFRYRERGARPTRGGEARVRGDVARHIRVDPYEHCRVRTLPVHRGACQAALQADGPHHHLLDALFACHRPHAHSNDDGLLRPRGGEIIPGTIIVPEQNFRVEQRAPRRP